MTVTRININTNVETPVLIGGVYNYNSGSSEGEIVPIAVTIDGKIKTQ